MMGRRSPTQRYSSEVCTTQGDIKTQLEILTLTFKKIVSYTLAGPGVTPGCIQTQRLSWGAMVEMLCLGVNSALPGSGQMDPVGSSSLKAMHLKQNIILNDFSSFPFSVFLAVLKDASYPRERACKEMHAGTETAGVLQRAPSRSGSCQLQFHPFAHWFYL